MQIVRFHQALAHVVRATQHRRQAMKNRELIFVLSLLGALAEPAGVGSLVAASIMTPAEAAMPSTAPSRPCAPLPRTPPIASKPSAICSRSWTGLETTDRARPRESTRVATILPALSGSIGIQIMNGISDRSSKVPAVTLAFWVVKILATTLGETGGDAVTMSMNLGYLVGTAIFTAILIVAISVQIAAKRFHPFLYWTVIVATTTTGTTLADFVDRSLGIGYLGGSTLLAILLMLSLGLWYRSMGSISTDSITSKKAEMFYWATIMFSQTLGTALGDRMADSTGLGYRGGAVVFAIGLAIIAAAYYWTTISRIVLFWAAFVLTRPLGATVGDFLDKPLDHGGLALSRYIASVAVAVLIVALIATLPQRAGRHPA